LESIENLRNSPAVICSLISLGESVGNTESVLQALDTGFKTLNKQADYYPNLLRKTADFKFKFGKYQDAAKIYKQLLELVQSSNSSEKSTEVEIMTLIAISYSNFDPASAKKYASKIAEISGGGKDTEVGKDSEQYATELEKLAVPVFKKKEKKEAAPTTTTSTTTKTGVSSSTTTKNVPTDTKKKKKRRNKPPKKIDPSIPVDPERWIPKQERSYYKGKRRGKAPGNRGAQGAVSASTAVQGGSAEGIPAAPIEEEKQPKLTPKQIAEKEAEEKAAAIKEAVQAAASARGAKAPRGRGRGRGRRK